MSNKINHCEILIIAAGQSKRLGEPKQLLKYNGQSFINRLIDTVNVAVNFPITLVLGANAEKIEKQLENTTLDIVINKDWEEGMASSIRVGLDHLIQKHEKLDSKGRQLDGVMILVCDQPFIQAEHISSLLHLQQSTLLPIAACYYAQVLGTPALFHKSIFKDLLALKGDIGAKKIINAKEKEVAKLHFENGVIDIDTMEDYLKYIQQEEASNND
jgi:molybdenum cofactor cytidylyltransferase